MIVVIENAAPGGPPLAITIDGHRHLVISGKPSDDGRIETIELSDEETAR